MSNNEVSTPPTWLGWARVGIGLAQGIAIFALWKIQGPAPPWLAAAMATALFLPVLIIGSLGALRGATLTIWAAVALMLSVGLPWYAVSRLSTPDRSVISMSFVVVAFVLFVGHHLVSAGDESRRWIASYDRYFDIGWRHVTQLALATLFTVGFWVVLSLGALLFDLLGLDFLSQLLRAGWFAWPATCAMFALAVHLTDLRAGLVRGARALGLALLSWLLPVMSGLTAAFLAALLLTGLEPLWATRAATAILLTVAGSLVLLINATYQDGATAPLSLLRWSARIASLQMTLLVGLAAYALYLRVAQYGLTPERVYAAAILVIGFCYAVAYALGAFWSRWMKPLELGNVVSAIATVVVAIALFTPIADPARLSVNDQMHRLRAGIVGPEQLDLAFLRFGGARFGQAALQQLRADRSTEEARVLSDRAAEMMATESRYQTVSTAPPHIELSMQPEGAAIPEDLNLRLDRDLAWMCANGTRCDGVLVDLNNDGEDEMLVGARAVVWAYGRERGRWRRIGTVVASNDIREIRAAMEAGRVRVVPAQVGDVLFNGDRALIRQEGTPWHPRGQADDAGPQAR